MSITIPLHAKVQFNNPRVEDDPLLLLTINDSTLTTPLRFCSLPIERLPPYAPPLRYGIISNGEQFEYGLSGSIPSDQEKTFLNSQLAIDNITQEYVDKFLALSVNNDAQINLILASDPNTLIRSFTLMVIAQCVVTVESIVLSLERNKKVFGESSALEPYPSGLQTYNQAPGLHR